MILGLLGVVLDKGVIDLFGVVILEMVFFGWEKGKQEGVDSNCGVGDFKEVRMDGEVRYVLLQFIVKEFFKEIGFFSSDDKVFSQERGVFFLFCIVVVEVTYLFQRVNSIEEVASRIVDVVIE